VVHAARIFGKTRPEWQSAAQAPIEFWIFQKKSKTPKSVPAPKRASFA
jgi:hypothetical protein